MSDNFQANNTLKNSTLGDRVAVFVGSFDPFTVGHKNILDRALPLFDKVIVGVGINEAKHYMLSTEERIAAIKALYKDDDRISVEGYSDFTTDFAQRHGAAYIIKGVRSVKDFEYERDQADINRRLTGIDTILFYSEPELSAVSSSLVREFKHFNKDISKFIP